MNDNDLLRYSRQILLPAIDIDGQQRLRDATVLLVGAGGLGCSLAQSLVGSGIGRLIIVDDDTVELSNLPRQVLFHDVDIGQSKAQVLCRRLRQRIPDCELIAVNQRADVALLTQLSRQYTVDILADGGDNLPLTQALDRVVTSRQLPLVHASVSRFEGHLYTRLPDKAYPTLTQLFPATADTETCSQSGVLTVAVSLVAAAQAAQIVRVLLAPALGKILPELLLFDGTLMRWTTIRL